MVNLSTALPLLATVSAGTSAAGGVTVGGFSIPALDANAEPAATDFGPAALLSLIGNGNPAPVPKAGPAAEKEREDLRTAQLLVSVGEYDAARGLADAILAKDRQNARATHILGQIALSDRDYGAAEKLFRKADFFDSSLGFIADAENARALKQDDEKVIAAAQRLVRGAETRADGTRLLANVVQRSPDNTAARLALAEAFLLERDAQNGMQQFAEAIDTADRTELGQIEARMHELAEVSPNAAAVQRLLGRTQLRLERYEDAANTLALAGRLAEGDADIATEESLAYVGIGRARLERGDVSGAFGSLLRAKDLNYGGAEVNHALAEAYVARGSDLVLRGAHSAGINDLRQAIFELNLYGIEDDGLRDRLGAAAYQAGRALERRREADGAEVGREVTAFQAAFDADPDNATYRAKLAETRHRMGEEFAADGKLKDAAYAFNRAAELLPQNEEYRNAAIDAFMAWGADAAAQQRYDDAIEAFTGAYNLNSEREDVRLNLAGAYNTRGLDRRERNRFSQAASDFREALRLFPHNTTYQANYDSVRYR